MPRLLSKANCFLPPGCSRRARATSALAALFLLVVANAAQAQGVDPNLWVTDGPVHAVAYANGTVYIGGQFSRVGPPTGPGVPLDDSGQLAPGFPKVVGGAIYAVAPDGSGGWYIGGSFSSVGGLARSNLARVRADMTVDSWNPSPEGQVNALIVDGSLVYVGGGFTTIGGQSRNRIAAVDAVTGAATVWNPNANNGVTCLQKSGTLVYAGGSFTSIGGQLRNSIAALSASTGDATGWNPNANGQVAALAIGTGVVYAAGYFTQMNGMARSHLAAIATDGSLTAWNPSPNGPVNAIGLSATHAYVGGQFDLIGGTPRSRLASVSLATGLTSPWNPAPDSMVSAITLAGSSVYVGGYFANIGGQSRRCLAAVDATTGLATAWNPVADGYVNVIDASGSFVYAGGYFQSMGGQTRNNLAAIQTSTGMPLAWSPNANGTVRALALDGSTLYVGGDFNTVGGVSHPGLAAVDASTGAVTSFTVSVTGGGVRAIALSGETIYVGGTFSGVSGSARTGLAAIKNSGALTDWNPNPDAPVHALVSHGGRVYAGGSFTAFAGVARAYVAQIDSITGAPTIWNAFANGAVYALATEGQRVYAGGEFTNIGFRPTNYLAALDTLTAVSSSTWDPSPNAPVHSLLATRSVLYAGGIFSLISGQARAYTAALALWPALATAAEWNPGASPLLNALAAGDMTIYAGGTFFGMAGMPQARIASIFAVPEFISAYPFIGGNVAPMAVTINGKAFQAGATAKLTRSGQPDIVGTSTTVAADGRSLTTTFDLTGRATGAWSAVITNPDLVSSFAVPAVLIQSVLAPQLNVSVLAPAVIRALYPTPFDVVIENPGNVDAVNVPLWITGIPASATVGTDFTLTAPPQSAGEPAWSGVPPTFTSPGGQYLPMVIPRVRPGVMTMRIRLTVPSSVPDFQIAAAVAPTWQGDPVFRGCLSGAGVITNPSCMEAQLTSINSYLTAHPEVEAMSGTGIWAKVAWQCEGATTLALAIAKSEQVLDYLDGPIESGTATPGCGDVLLPRWLQSLVVRVVFSIDPNDKLGPSGGVSSTQSIPYSIRFENLSSATVAARQVTIQDVLSTNLDLNSLSLGAINLFGTVTLLPLPGSKQYSRDLDLGHDNLIVRITANLDVVARRLTWSFTTLDKTTLLPPTNALLGFLPPNQTPPQGEGSVQLTIRPSSSTPNGTTIVNNATINFDGTILTTPAVNNVLDNLAPSSTVQSLGTPISTTSFPVSWTGSGGDLRDYTIYVAEDTQPYQVWKLNTQNTSDVYTPRPGGHNYAFYSVSRDASGNIETAPSSPDAQTYSTTAVGEPGGAGLSLLGAQPNPARGVLRVVFSLANSKPARLELVDLAGRRVLRREVGGMGPGSHVLALDSTPSLKSGLYFVRLIQGERELRTRIVLMR